MPSILHWLTYERLFVIGSLLVAFSIIIQMLSLYRHQGKISNLPAIIQLLSFVDGAWFFVSIATLYFLELNPINKSIAIVFILYMIVAFFYAGTTMENKLPQRPEDIIFSKRYMDFNIAFAIVFVLLCSLNLWLIIKNIQPTKILSLFVI